MHASVVAQLLVHLAKRQSQRKEQTFGKLDVAVEAGTEAVHAACFHNAFRIVVAYGNGVTGNVVATGHLTVITLNHSVLKNLILPVSVVVEGMVIGPGGIVAQVELILNFLFGIAGTADLFQGIGPVIFALQDGNLPGS